MDTVEGAISTLQNNLGAKQDAIVDIVRVLKNSADADFDTNNHVAYVSGNTSVNVAFAGTVLAVFSESPSGTRYPKPYVYSGGALTCKITADYDFSGWKIVIVGN